MVSSVLNSAAEHIKSNADFRKTIEANLLKLFQIPRLPMHEHTNFCGKKNRQKSLVFGQLYLNLTARHA